MENYGKRHIPFLLKIEQKLEKIFFKAENSFEIVIDSKKKNKLNFILTLLDDHYHLEMSYFNLKKKTKIIGTITEEFMIPKVTLSQYIE